MSITGNAHASGDSRMPTVISEPVTYSSTSTFSSKRQAVERLAQRVRHLATGRKSHLALRRGTAAHDGHARVSGGLGHRADRNGAGEACTAAALRDPRHV